MLSRQFITAGRAVFTVHNASGEHCTFRVKKSKPRGEYTQPAYFASVLTGPDNESDYTYLGLLDPQTGEVRLTAKSKYSDDSRPVRVLRWAIGRIYHYPHEPLPAGYGIHHEGRCGRCNRTLTTPESVDLGIGPECMKKVMKAIG